MNNEKFLISENAVLKKVVRMVNLGIMGLGKMMA